MTILSPYTRNGIATKKGHFLGKGAPTKGNRITEQNNTLVHTPSFCLVKNKAIYPKQNAKEFIPQQ